MYGNVIPSLKYDLAPKLQRGVFQHWLTTEQKKNSRPTLCELTIVLGSIALNVTAQPCPHSISSPNPVHRVISVHICSVRS